MSTPLYRLTVLACAVAWFLVGLHTPVLHQITGHGRVPGAGLVTILVLLVVIAGGSLLMLLRAPRSHEDSTPA